MKAIKILLILAALVNLSTSVWEISFRKGNEQSNLAYEVNKGFFTHIHVTVSSCGDKTDSEVTLDLPETSSFKLNHPLHIRTIDSHYFDTYIGLSCQSKLKPGDEYTLNFVLTGKDVANFECHNITLKVGENKANLTLDQSMSTIPAGGFGYVNLKENLLNFEPFVVEFTSTAATPQGEVEKMEFDSFFGYRRPINKAYFKYTAKEYTTDPQIFTYSVPEDSPMSKCIQIPEDFEFSISNDPIPKVSEYKDAFIEAITFNDDFQDKNGFSIKFVSFPVSPAVISCVAQSYSYRIDFPSVEEIRDYKNLPVNEYTNYNHSYIGGTDGFALSFENLTRLEDFKVKCVIDSIHSDETQRDSFDFTLGDFNEASKRGKFNGPSPFKLIEMCATWQFENYVNVDTFSERFTKQCNFILFHTLQPSPTEGGCASCKRVNIQQDPHTVQICLVPAHQCNTDYAKDFTPNFTALYESVNTTEKILKEFGLENFKLKNVYLNGNQKLDENKLTFEILSKSQEELIARIVNDNSMDVECYSKMEKVTDGISRFSFEYSDEEKIILKSGKGLDLKFSYPGLLTEEEMYPIYFVCHRRDFEYNKKGITTPFSIFTYLYTNRTWPDDPVEPKHDCEKDIFNVQCIPKENHLLPEIKSDNYNIFIDDAERTALAALDPKEQRIYLEFKKYLLLNATTDEEILKYSTYFSHMLAGIQCAKYDSYDKCTKYKTGFMKEIINKVKNLPSERKPKNDDFIWFHHYIVTFFYILNTPDSIDKESYDALLDMSKKLKEAMTNYFGDEQIDESLKADSARILLGVSSNLINLIPYAEVQGYIKSNLYEGSIILDKLAEQVRNHTRSMIELLYTHAKETTIDLDNLNIYGIDLDNRPNQEMQVPGTNVTLVFNASEFKKEFPNSYILIANYKKYPYISMKNKKYWEDFIGLNILDKASEKLSQPTVKSDIKLHYTDFMNPIKVLRLNEKKELEDTEISSTLEDNELTATIKQFGDFTLEKEVKEKKKNNKKVIIIVCSIIGGLVFIAIVVFIVHYFKKKKSKEIRISASETPLVQEDFNKP